MNSFRQFERETSNELNVIFKRTGLLRILKRMGNRSLDKLFLFVWANIDWGCGMREEGTDEEGVHALK